MVQAVIAQLMIQVVNASVDVIHAIHDHDAGDSKPARDNAEDDARGLWVKGSTNSSRSVTSGQRTEGGNSGLNRVALSLLLDQTAIAQALGNAVTLLRRDAKLLGHLTCSRARLFP
jgi:hypothetical protein